MDHVGVGEARQILWNENLLGERINGEGASLNIQNQNI
jgi:hypothetical protein